MQASSIIIAIFSTISNSEILHTNSTSMVDSISYGEDIYTTMQKNIEQSEIILILVSQSYIHNKWCIHEFTSIMNMNKKIIPIIMDSFEDLCQLPKDISNIKALSFSSSEKNLKNSYYDYQRI